MFVLSFGFTGPFLLTAFLGELVLFVGFFALIFLALDCVLRVTTFLDGLDLEATVFLVFETFLGFVRRVADFVAVPVLRVAEAALRVEAEAVRFAVVTLRFVAAFLGFFGVVFFLVLALALTGRLFLLVLEGDFFFVDAFVTRFLEAAEAERFVEAPALVRDVDLARVVVRFVVALLFFTGAFLRVAIEYPYLGD